MNRLGCALCESSDVTFGAHRQFETDGADWLIVKTHPNPPHSLDDTAPYRDKSNVHWTTPDHEKQFTQRVGGFDGLTQANIKVLFM